MSSRLHGLEQESKELQQIVTGRGVTIQARRTLRNFMVLAAPKANRRTPKQVRCTYNVNCGEAFVLDICSHQCYNNFSPNADDNGNWCDAKILFIGAFM